MSGPFDETRLKTPWSMILSAQQKDPELRRACLEYLFTLYRRPALRFVELLLARANSLPLDAVGDDADDIVQAFSLHFLEKALLERLDPERGGFRAFLMTTLKRFVADEYRKRARRAADGALTRLAHPVGRGGEVGETVSASALAQQADPSAPTPETVFLREYAQVLVRRAVKAFRQQCADRSLPHYFAVFERHIWRPDDFGRPGYAESAAVLGCSEGDVRNHLSRAKPKFQQLLRELVRQTVATDEEVENELTTLQALFI